MGICDQAFIDISSVIDQRVVIDSEITTGMTGKNELEPDEVAPTLFPQRRGSMATGAAASAMVWWQTEDEQ